MSLFWTCTGCQKLEPVDLEDVEGYEVGDQEPCVDCLDGTATLVSVPA